MRRSWTIWFLLLAGALAGGCATSSRRDCPDDASCDLAHLARAHTLQEGETVLTPKQVQRAAVANSGQASAMETDSQGNGSPDGCPTCSTNGKTTRLLRELRGYTSDEIRNQSAGLALKAYFALAEARLQLQLLQEGRAIVERLVAQAEDFQKKGLTPPEEITQTKRRLSQLLSDQQKVEIERDRLTEQLRSLVGPGLCTCKVGTLEVFHVVEEPIDEKLAIAIALKYRPELNLLRSAHHNLDVTTLPLIRQLLGGTNPMLGNRIRRCLPLLDCLPRLVPIMAMEEIEKVKRELEALLCERERTVVSDVRQAIRQIHGKARLTLLARDRDELARQRLADVEERQRKGLPTEAQMNIARRDHVQTRTEVLHEAIGWEMARVELRRAQGLLVREVLAPIPECLAAAPPQPLTLIPQPPSAPLLSLDPAPQKSSPPPDARRPD